MGEAIISRSSASTSDSSTSGQLINEIIMSSMNWVAPKAKDQKFRVILFGGGEAGSVYGTGGNGGFMNCGDFTISEGSSIPISIGLGGTPCKGYLESDVDNRSHTKSGRLSKFGSYLTANGGSINGGGSGGGGGSSLSGRTYNGGNAHQFGGGGGGYRSCGGNGGKWGGGGGSGLGDYRSNGGEYGGKGGNGGTDWATIGKEINRYSDIIPLGLHILGQSSLSKENSGGGGGGYGSRGGGGWCWADGVGGGGGGYGPNADGGNSFKYCGSYRGGGGGGGGFFAKGGEGGQNGGGGGGGCGLFGLNGKGGNGYINISTCVDKSGSYNNVNMYIKAEDGGIAAGGGGGFDYEFSNTNCNYLAIPGNGGDGVCIIQYYL